MKKLTFFYNPVCKKLSNSICGAESASISLLNKMIDQRRRTRDEFQNIFAVFAHPIICLIMFLQQTEESAEYKVKAKLGGGEPAD